MGIVYLLGDWEKEGIYKIGVTRGKLENRIKKLQTGNSGEIYVVKYHESKKPFFVEKYLHRKFHMENVKNEWFSLEFDDVTHFKDYCAEAENILEALKDNPFSKNFV